MQILKRAPLPCILFIIAGGVIGFYFARDWYVDRLEGKDEQIVRLKIAAGVNTPTQQTALTELTNSELKTKALHLAKRIREILDIHDQHASQIYQDKEANKITGEQWKARILGENKRAWKQFETIRVDTFLVCDELRARLPPKIQERVLSGTNHFRSSDEPNAIFSVGQLASGPFLVEGAYYLAAELEELSKMQLSQLKTCN